VTEKELAEISLPTPPKIRKSSQSSCSNPKQKSTQKSVKAVESSSTAESGSRGDHREKSTHQPEAVTG